MIYCYRKRLPQTREEHSVEYTREYFSDIAITIALSKKQAIKRFSECYYDVKPRQVTNITNKFLICLLKGWTLIFTDFLEVTK